MTTKLPSIDELNNILQNEVKDDKTELDVLKELFTLKNVETKTELSTQQIILINQKRAIAKLIGFDKLNIVLDDFMFLMISKERKGRSEFVDGFKSNREQQMQNSGLFQSFKDRLSNK